MGTTRKVRRPLRRSLASPRAPVFLPRSARQGVKLKRGEPPGRAVRRAKPAMLALLVALPSLTGCVEGGRLVGEPLPAFSLVDSEGRVVNETTHLGRWLVLDLMATWCGPCKLEVAHLREVQRLHGDDVVILSVGVDRGETLEDLRAFGEEHGATWPYAIDRDGSVSRALRLGIIPKLIVVDPEGVVVLERQGEVLPAAISRVIDPSVAAPGRALPWWPALAGLGLGALAPLNPWRRLHRHGAGPRAATAALALLALPALLAWPFADLVSSRATYGSLALGAVSLAAALWWLRARRREAPVPGGAWWLEAGDRAYEAAPHFGAALLLALTGAGALGFAAPLAAFFAGALASVALAARAPEPWRERAGLAGLALAGAGLLAFGLRILAAQA